MATEEQTSNQGVYYDGDLGYFTSANAERKIAKLREKYGDWEITPIFTEVTDREGQVTYAEPILRYQIRKAIPGGLLDIRLLDTEGNETYREVEQQRGLLQSPVLGILASAVLPGLGEFFAAQLAAAGALTGAAATTVGNALAKIAVDVAMGKDLEDAVRDTAISAGISAGMPNIAPAISELVNDPNIGRILQNAGTAAVNAAVQGRDGQGILLAAVGAAGGTAAAVEGGATAGRAVQSLIASGGDPAAALAAVGGDLAGQAGQTLAREVTQGGGTGLPEGVARLPSTPDTGTRVATEPNLPVTSTTVTTTGGGAGGGGGGGQGGQAAVDPNSQEVLIAQQFLPAGVRIQTFNQLEAVRVLSEVNPNLLASMSQGQLNEAAGYILNNQEQQLAQQAAVTPIGQGLGLVPRSTNVFTVETIPQDMSESFIQSDGAVYSQVGNRAFRVASQDEVNQGYASLLYDDQGRAYYGVEVFGFTTPGRFMTDVERQAEVQQQFVTEASEQIDPETGQPMLLTPGTGGNIGGGNVARFLTASVAKGIGEQLGYIATATGNRGLESIAANLQAYGRGATSASVRMGQNDIVTSIANADGFGKVLAGLGAALRNPAATLDWGLSEGVQEFVPLLAGVGVGRAVTGATKLAFGKKIADKYGIAAAVGTNATLDAGESAIATYQNVRESLINRGFSEERASRIALPAAFASGLITLVTTALGESELVAAATRGVPGSVARSFVREAPSEFAEGFGQGVVEAVAITNRLPTLDQALTQGTLEALIGGTTTAGITAGQAVTTGGTEVTGTGTATTGGQTAVVIASDGNNSLVMSNNGTVSVANNGGNQALNTGAVVNVDPQSNTITAATGQTDANIANSGANSTNLAVNQQTANDINNSVSNLATTQLVTGSDINSGAATAAVVNIIATTGATSNSVNNVTAEVVSQVTGGVSAEQQQKIAAVTQLYQELLGRAPDAEGLAFYTDPASNFSLEVIRADIANSPEAVARAATATGTGTVGTTGGTNQGVVAAVNPTNNTALVVNTAGTTQIVNTQGDVQVGNTVNLATNTNTGQTTATTVGTTADTATGTTAGTAATTAGTTAATGTAAGTTTGTTAGTTTGTGTTAGTTTGTGVTTGATTGAAATTGTGAVTGTTTGTGTATGTGTGTTTGAATTTGTTTTPTTQQTITLTPDEEQLLGDILRLIGEGQRGEEGEAGELIGEVGGVPGIGIQEQPTITEEQAARQTAEARRQQRAAPRGGGPSITPTFLTPRGPQALRGLGTQALQESLTSFRPAGEIRAGTGKPRRNVWNEASLRLKDALGL